MTFWSTFDENIKFTSISIWLKNQQSESEDVKVDKNVKIDDKIQIDENVKIDEPVNFYKNLHLPHHLPMVDFSTSGLLDQKEILLNGKNTKEEWNEKDKNHN